MGHGLEELDERFRRLLPPLLDRAESAVYLEDFNFVSRFAPLVWRVAVADIVARNSSAAKPTVKST
jgi:hypothetical protein